MISAITHQSIKFVSLNILLSSSVIEENQSLYQSLRNLCQNLISLQFKKLKARRKLRYSKSFISSLEVQVYIYIYINFAGPNFDKIVSRYFTTFPSINRCTAIDNKRQKHISRAVLKLKKKTFSPPRSFSPTKR